MDIQIVFHEKPENDKQFYNELFRKIFFSRKLHNRSISQKATSAQSKLIGSPHIA